MTFKRIEPPEDLDPRHGQYVIWRPDGRKGPAWLLRVQWSRIDGRLECVGLEVRSFHETGEDWLPDLPDWRGARPLTATVLRRLSLGAVLDELREEAWRLTEEWADSIEDPQDKESVEVAERIRASARRSRRRRRERVQHTSAEVAAVYMAALARRGNPTEAVQRTWKVSYSTAAKWVMKARGEGHLPPSGRKGKRDA